MNHFCGILKGHSTINSANEYEPDVLNTFCATGRLKNSKFYKECMGSLALLQLRNFAVFERQCLIQYYTQRAKALTRDVLSFASSLPSAWSQYIPNKFSSVGKVVCK